LEHDLYVKAEKFLFFQQAVFFLGYRISTSGVEMESDRRFLRFANYYRGFGQVAAPITSLLKGVLYVCSGRLRRTGLLGT
jgi:hypothetical protein